MTTPCTAEQILGWRGWKDYLAALEKSPHRELARTLSRQKAPQVLASGASIVRAIAQFHPGLLSKPPRIAIVATDLSGPEFMDRGRWLLNGMPLLYPDDYPEVALFRTHPHVQPEAPQIESGFLRMVAGIPPLPLVEGDVGASLEAYRPDLIVLLYPACCDTSDQSMEEYRWLQGWVDRGTPIVGCYYDAAERSLGQGYFACAGIAHQRHADSPLSFTLPHSLGALMSFGEALFSLEKPIPNHPHKFNELQTATHVMGVYARRDDAAPMYGAILQGRFGGQSEPVVTAVASVGVGMLSGHFYHVTMNHSGQVAVIHDADAAPVDTDVIAEMLPAPIEQIPEYRRSLIVQLLCSGALVPDQEDDDLDADFDDFFGGQEVVLPAGDDRKALFDVLREALPMNEEERGAFDSLTSLMTAPTGMMDEIPLFVAADTQNLAEIRNLIRTGCDPNQHDRAGWTPLSHCVADDRLDALRVLLEEGAHIDEPLTINGATPLMIALQRGKDAAALLLLQAGADLDVQSLVGTPRDVLLAGDAGEIVQGWFAENA